MKDYFGYGGKRCVVTGAASGMGKATAELLVELGAVVYALDYNEAEIPGIKAFVQVNLGDKDSIDKAFADLPQNIDSYFGVAGVSGASHDPATTITINLIANKYITETYLADRITERGAIAYVSSVGGSKWHMHEIEYKDIIEANTWDEMVTAAQNKPVGMGVQGYVISKRGMTYYTRYAVLAFTDKAVRVNCIAPGLTASGLEADFQMLSGGTQQAGDKMYGVKGRSGTSEEMANALIFLNSDMAEYVNGVELFVDDGREALNLTHGWLDNNIAPMWAR